jgi:hypothetical protein
MRLCIARQYFMRDAGLRDERCPGVDCDGGYRVSLKRAAVIHAAKRSGEGGIFLLLTLRAGSFFVIFTFPAFLYKGQSSA